MGSSLARKSDKSEMGKVWEQFKSYALYQDLKDLYGKVIPPLSAFETKMNEMCSGYEQSREMIRRYDEIISEKANKTAVKEVYEIMRNFIKIDKLKEFSATIDKKFESVLAAQD